MNANQRLSSPNYLAAPLLINEMKNDHVNHWCNELEEENSFTNVQELDNQQAKIVTVSKNSFINELN
ncbi:hypothetical protein MUO14_21760 [Halobacillus shinanisalinarum]|uniref:Uncharacterized protein n=1 Tax=Halobacillus shinanisalinarum TaxID=2932258 RepID=A0ABY4GY51_9BACI|nr:hypothetical protein [Halobacillus shinanisalinarum]UOQ92994.1 hypothetical protein MUO14_21760 [Halobacillus shinanisalinarum]